MKFRLLTTLALLPVFVQADFSIYSDQLDNGWTNWSWATVAFNNTAYHHSGADSISVTSGSWQAIYLHHDAISTANYQNLSLWVNGGVKGGQSLQLQATLSTNQQVAYPLPKLSPNTWVHLTIPLTTLGVGGKPNFDGFWIQETSGAGAPTYYLDDISLTQGSAPNPILVTVDATRPLQTLDGRMFGVNTAVWDSQLSSSTTRSLLTDAGVSYLRFPGGSLADIFHWATNQTTDGTLWTTNFANFMSTATTVGAQPIITTNYGTGNASEAAAWVRQANITNHFAIKYWEVGNENYGTWEADSHAAKNDPFTYAQQYVLYRTAMKAVDPTISVGAVIPVGEDSFANNASHPAKNPRTGVVHNGFGPVMLATLKSLGAAPDFVVYHYYAQEPGSESDEVLLNSTPNWKGDIAQLRQTLNDYLGTPLAKSVQIQITENNSCSYNPGKQSTSLVNGLYLAESFGYAAQTEALSFIWWDLRNGPDGSQNNSSTLYGWRNYGDYGIVSPSNERYPVYFALKAVKYFVRPGDSILTTTTGYYRLAAFAAKKANGDLTLMVVNKDPSSTYNVQFSIAGYLPAATATTYSYGIPQDQAARTGIGSTDVSTGTFNQAGASFTTSFAPYSITVIDLKKAAAGASRLRQKDPK